MKKIICMVLVFGAIMLCAVPSAPAQVAGDEEAGGGQAGVNALPTPPAGHSVRYVLPYFKSHSTDSTKVLTLIRVYNHSNKDCVFGVQFRKGGDTVDSCSVTFTLGAQQSFSLCSRNVSPLVNCEASCPDPGLTLNTGHAYISSPGGCTNLAVDGQIVYSTTDDTVMSGMSSLRVVKYGSPSKGD